MGLENKAVKAGLGYTVGNILVKGINFLTIPLFSRILTTAEFGAYNVFLSYDAILFVLIGFAMAVSVKSAHYEFGKADEYVSSISLIYIINAVFYLIIILIGGERLSSWLSLSETALLLLVPFSFGGAVMQLYNERISIDYNYRKYMIVAIVNSVGNVVISLILIVTIFKEKRDIGRMVGAAATIFCLAFILLLVMYKKAAPKFNKEFWRFGLKFSLPIVPHGISQVLLAHFDRIMISKMVGDSEAGIYSLAGNLKLVMVVISASICTSWNTWFFSKMEKNDVKSIQKSASVLIRLFLILSVGLMALSPELIMVLGGPDYELGKYVAVPMIMDAFLLFLYNIVVSGEYYTKKTHYIMLGTMMAAVINIVTNYIFIKMYGFIAAAYTTLFSYICYLIFHMIISKKLIKFEVVEWKWILFTSTVIAAAAAVDLVFVGNIIVRYIVCAVMVGALCPPVIKFYLSVRQKSDDK